MVDEQPAIEKTRTRLCREMILASPLFNLTREQVNALSDEKLVECVATINDFNLRYMQLHNTVAVVRYSP